MTLSPARHIALRVVRTARERDAWTREILSANLDKAELSDSDRALTRRLAIGVAQMKDSLDWAIDHFLDKPKNMEPKVRDAMRLATYEILFMRTPDRAAVHQGVEAVKSVNPKASGLANAVLRRITEGKDSFPWDVDNDLEKLALKVGHPLWIVEKLVDQYGLDVARSILFAGNEPPPLFIAANLFKTDIKSLFKELEDLGAEPSMFGPANCIKCENAEAVIRSDILTGGRAIVADAAGQTAVQVTGIQAGDAVLDLAAGRGTKTFLLQNAALSSGGPAKITTVDVHSFKTDILNERVQQLEIPDVITYVADATEPEQLRDVLGSDPFDVILIDAPCSGLGTLRRNPERRWRLDSDDITRLADIGLKMLKSASSLVRPGGFVVYSTCTVLIEENDQVIDAFLASSEGDGFSEEDLRDRLPEVLQRFGTPPGRFQSIPEIDGIDGHFASLLRKS